MMEARRMREPNPVMGHRPWGSSSPPPPTQPPFESRRSGWQSVGGIASLVVALLLSPAVILPVFLNDTTPEALRPYALQIIVASVLVSVVWNAATMWAVMDKPGVWWAVAGLAVSLVGGVCSWLS
jgi:hypothetical protein